MVTSMSLKSKLIPIVPQSGIYLYPHGFGNERRFAKVFRDTWWLLPPDARRRILKHWREDCWRLLGGVLDWEAACANSETPIHDSTSRHIISPRIELLPGYSDGTKILKRALRNQPLASVFAFGHILRFHSTRVERMPDEIVQLVVVHELAHVHQYSVEMEYLFNNRRNSEHVEEDAMLLAWQWGFDERRLGDWIVMSRSREATCIPAA